MTKPKQGNLKRAAIKFYCLDPATVYYPHGLITLTLEWLFTMAHLFSLRLKYVHNQTAFRALV